MKHFLFICLACISSTSFSMTSTEELNFQDYEDQLSQMEYVDDLRVTRVIVRDSSNEPICYMTSSEWFDSQLEIPSSLDNKLSGIKRCEANQISAYADLFSDATHNPELAALPAVLGVGLFACSLGAISGVAIQSIESLFIEDFTPNQPNNLSVYGIPAMVAANNIKVMEGVKGARKVGALTGAGIVSVVCAELAEMGTKIGLDFVLE